MTLEIDALDPLIPMLAIQHDFRERFFHALQEIVDAVESEASVEDRLDKVGFLARLALDHEDIQNWMADNRPMPWLDDLYGEEAQELTVRVMDILGQNNTIA